MSRGHTSSHRYLPITLTAARRAVQKPAPTRGLSVNGTGAEVNPATTRHLTYKKIPPGPPAAIEGGGAGNPARSRLSGGFRRLKAGGSQDWLPTVTSQIA